MPDVLPRRQSAPLVPIGIPVGNEASRPSQKRRPRSEGRAPPPSGPPPGSLTPGAPAPRGGAAWCYNAQPARPRPVPLTASPNAHEATGSKASRSRSTPSLLSSGTRTYSGSAVRLRDGSKRLPPATSTAGVTSSLEFDCQSGNSSSRRAPGPVEWPIRDLCAEEGIDLTGVEELDEHEIPVDDLDDFLSDFGGETDELVDGDITYKPPEELVHADPCNQPTGEDVDKTSEPERRVGVGGVRPCYGGGGLAAPNKSQRRTASNQPFAGRSATGQKGLGGSRSTPDLKPLAKTLTWDKRTSAKADAMGIHGAAATSAWGAFHSWCNSQLPIDVWDQQIKQGASFKASKWG